MKNLTQLEVYYNDSLVGSLEQSKLGDFAFAYDKKWLAEGFSISPFSLPLENRVFFPPHPEYFRGLFGIFSDSLPDGWGRLLVDRMLTKQGIHPNTITALTRLSLVGAQGMGALSYRPAQGELTGQSLSDFDAIAASCSQILSSQSEENLDELYQMAGSSGGARPKVLYRLNDEDWIVKFPSNLDGANIGKQEYDYMHCAKACGIEIPEIRLLPSAHSAGYFACKRFDRQGEKRIHMASVSALLETSHRLPNLDYCQLMDLCYALCKDFSELEKLFRLACFNVFAHNRDDHSKNFSFLYKDGRWKLSPAYDLTYSNSLGGEHATTVAGEGKNPSLKHLLQVAKHIGFNSSKAKRIAEQIQVQVKKDLSPYLKASSRP